MNWWILVRFLHVVVLIGVLTGLHVVTPATQALSIAVLVASLVAVWLGVALTH